MFIYKVTHYGPDSDEVGGWPNSWLPSAVITQNIQFDSSNWYVENGVPVHFSSRGRDDIILSGAYHEVNKNAPVVIVVHGIKPSHKASSSPLLVSAMLLKSGFNTLRIDLQNYGDSTHLDSFIRLGQTEYKDILGAFDWLLQYKKYHPSKVGIVGLSLGAVTSAIAFSQEPQLASVWLDSPFFDFSAMCEHELTVRKMPLYLCRDSIRIGRLIIGINPNAISCKEALLNHGSRPIFLTHGENDSRIPFSHSELFKQMGDQYQTDLDTWFIPGADHLEGMYQYPYHYQEKLVQFFSRSLKYSG
ncbi:MAG: alpha/beta fold hydrolase [Pseudomonadota bacterium]|nr:alpha/beta fold hydrolase [Pseudomonadota bacterium]